MNTDTRPPAGYFDHLFDQPTFRSGFRRNRKGTLWRFWQGKTVSVFARGNRFAFCIADLDGLYFSPDSYATEVEALGALSAALEV